MITVYIGDTDSLKLENGFDKSIIDNYNTNVIKKLQKVSKDLDIPFYKFSPKDKDGIEHTLGLFENDGNYAEFITQGAKKYAYKKWIKNEKLKKGMNIVKKGKDKSLVLEITVSGVPKSGAKALKKLEDFKDNLVFDFKDTNKYIIYYNDDEREFELEDYTGIKTKVDEKYGCCLLPTTYTLGKSLEYVELLSELSSARAIYGGD